MQKNSASDRNTWICSCQAENRLHWRTCAACGREMSPYVKAQLYRQELRHQKEYFTDQRRTAYQKLASQWERRIWHSRHTVAYVLVLILVVYAGVAVLCNSPQAAADNALRRLTALPTEKAESLYLEKAALRRLPAAAEHILSAARERLHSLPAKNLHLAFEDIRLDFSRAERWMATASERYIRTVEKLEQIKEWAEGFLNGI